VKASTSDISCPSLDEHVSMAKTEYNNNGRDIFYAVDAGML
jgi:hypothetical protein